MLYLEYYEFFNFYIVYINEAHAENEWPVRIEPSLCILQHENNQQRIQQAIRLQNEFGCIIPVVIDSIYNIFSNLYALWPLRAFIIQNNKLQWCLQPKNPGYYDLYDVRFGLQNYYKLIKRSCNII